MSGESRLGSVAKSLVKDGSDSDRRELRQGDHRSAQGARARLRGAGLPGLILSMAIVGISLAGTSPINDYYLTLLTDAAAYGVAALGLVVVLGYAGQISLAQASFFGVGAYAVAIGTTMHHLDFWVSAALGLVLAAALGAVLGMLSLRVGGHYLAMVTITFQVIFSLFLVNQGSLTQGPNGITGVPRPQIGPWTLDSNQSYLVFCLTAFSLVAALVWWLARTRFGRAMRALRENELAAEVSGVPTYRVKVGAFVVSAVLAAAGGMLFAGAFQFVSPDDFNFGQSILLLTMTLVGGARSIFGAAIGTTLVVFLPEWLRFLSTVYLAVYGGVLVLFMLVAPDGIWGFLSAIARRLVRPRLPTVPESTPLRFARQEHPGEFALEVRGLVKHFGGVKAVDGVDLQVKRGEVHALIGPNGSGKTTTLNVISGIYRPTSGSVILNGKNIAGRRPHRIASYGIARTFQLIRLMKSETVLENVIVGAQLAVGPRRGSRQVRTRALSALELVGMASFAHGPVVSLPYGHQRRVEIARALASMPSVVLLDEPGAGLNQTEKQELVELIKALKAQSLTILLIEHDMELVRSVSDTVSVLNFGQRIASGDCAAVLEQPEVLTAYLGLGLDGTA